MKVDIASKLNQYSVYWFISLLFVLSFLFFFYYVKEMEIADILNVQFAHSYSRLKALLSFNSEFILNVKLDFIFIVFYSLLFFLSVKVFDCTLLLGLGNRYVLFSLIPGLFDLLENSFLLLMLMANKEFHNGEILFWLFWLFSRLKWFVIIFFLLLNLTIVMYYIVLFFNRVTSDVMKK